VIIKQPFKKTAMALLVTLLFIMLISVAIGVGLKYLNSASSYVSGEKFLYQSSIIVDDVLNLLAQTPELNDINSSEDLENFLLYSPIPFESSGIKVMIELSSARSKYNINSTKDLNKTIMNMKIDALKRYFEKYMVNVEFVDILLDGISGVKEDYSYNSEIFNEKPYLFRDYMTSNEHFEEFKKFYEKRYDDENLKNIKIKNLFYFSRDINNSYRIDLNFATKEVWEMILSCDETRAEELSSSIDIYESYESIDLSDEELNMITNIFKTSLFEPYIDVKIMILQGTNTAQINFEYDIKNKKGSNFVYEI
jgi:hypothetical protein